MKIILIPTKTLPGKERPLELGKASLGRRQCWDILLQTYICWLVPMLMFSAAPWICCFGRGIAPSSTAPGWRRVLTPSACFGWGLRGHRQLGH